MPGQELASMLQMIADPEGRARPALPGPRSGHGCTPDGRCPGLSDTMVRRETTRRQREATMGGSEIEDRLLARLSGLGEVSNRPLFGGLGIYWRGVIFGILFQDRLYLKVDDRSRGDYLARGMGPFRPNERQTLRSYYEVPPEVLDDPEALLCWAKEAIRAGQVSSGRG